MRLIYQAKATALQEYLMAELFLHHPVDIGWVKIILKNYKKIIELFGVMIEHIANFTLKNHSRI